MTNNNQINEPEADWPVSFEDVEKDHLMQMLKMTPAQRLALAEELLGFAISAGAVKAQKNDDAFF